MEHTYAIPQPQASWFVYQPANDPQHRPHGHFMPSPSEQVYNSAMQYQRGMSYPQPYLHHPGPNHQQPFHQKPTFHGNMTMTPGTSPQPPDLKPAMVFKQEPSSLRPLDTNVFSIASSFSPSTPPLSSSGSANSSPPSSSMALTTPTNGTDFGFQAWEVAKGAAKGFGHADLCAGSLSNVDWSRLDSPPMTPGKPKFYISPYIYFLVHSNCGYRLRERSFGVWGPTELAIC